MDEFMKANRVNWNERVPVHVTSQFYDVERWLQERPGPRDWEVQFLGDVSGLDIVHLQCHFGLDTLALATAGGRVTGVDFSPAAIEAARALAERAGLGPRAQFIEANVLDAAETLSPETFDLVYVSLGSLCWLPSVQQWAAQVAALLRPTARLYLHDDHPLAWALADEELVVEHTYFEEQAPYVGDDNATYTDGEARLTNTRAYEWNHSLGETVTALLDHGLRISALAEHDWTVWRRFPWLIQTPDHRWTSPPGRPRLPLTYTLVATLAT